MEPKSKVFAEMEKDAIIMRKHMGEEYEIEVCDVGYGNGAYIEILSKNFDFGHLNGVIQQYAPDPDTRKQALKKAHELQWMKEENPNIEWCHCERSAHKYLVSWGTVQYTGSSIEFEFSETNDQ